MPTVIHATHKKSSPGPLTAESRDKDLGRCWRERERERDEERKGGKVVMHE